MMSELETLTGANKDTSPPSRTKDHADHAGHSPPLEPLKVSANKEVTSRASLSNNSLTAQAASATKPATVVLWITPSNTLKPTVSSTRTNIPTRPSNKPAKRMPAPSKSPASLTFPTATPSPQNSLEDPSQLPSMPPTGHPTNPEFSTTARPPSTTVSSLSDLLILIGLSRTHGEPHGERTDMSDSPEETHAVSATLPHTLNDYESNPFLYYSYHYLLT